MFICTICSVSIHSDIKAYISTVVLLCRHRYGLIEDDIDNLCGYKLFLPVFVIECLLCELYLTVNKHVLLCMNSCMIVRLIVLKVECTFV